MDDTVEKLCHRLTYENVLLGQIIIYETKNKLLNLKISEYQKMINNTLNNIKDIEDDETALSLKHSLQINITELELEIASLQIKTKLNDLSSTRLKLSIPTSQSSESNGVRLVLNQQEKE